MQLPLTCRLKISAEEALRNSLPKRKARSTGIIFIIVTIIRRLTRTERRWQETSNDGFAGLSDDADADSRTTPKLTRVV
jgi:hypothetical protein